MVKIQKDNIIKEVSDNIVSNYLNLGWELVDEKKVVKETKEKKSSFSSKVE